MFTTEYLRPKGRFRTLLQRVFFLPFKCLIVSLSRSSLSTFHSGDSGLFDVLRMKTEIRNKTQSFVKMKLSRRTQMLLL